MIDLRSGGSVRLLVAALILLVPTLAIAGTLTVTATGETTIADALAAAVYGDIVVVDCGVYQEQGLVMPDGVTLSGATDDPACVRIESVGGLPVFICEGVEGLTNIKNLTLTVAAGGMTTKVARGGGVYLKNASPIFDNCVFTGLEADFGGAVYCGEGSSPSFVNCWFEGNYSRAIGGAAACTGAATPLFYGCLFVGNTAESAGGTINAALGASPTIVGCTMIGSGLSSWDTDGVTFERVILTGGGWVGDAGSAPVFDCSNIFNSGVDMYKSANANISADPQFCGSFDSDNPYTLNASSPCAAAANPVCNQIGAFDVNCDFVSEVPEGSAVPLVSRLHANYPNPFNPRTTIMFDLSASGPVNLAVFDVAGRLVKRLVNESMAAGSHDVVWAGRDSGDRLAPAGVYFFRLKTNDTVDTKRMTLIK